MSVITGKISSLIQCRQVKIKKLGRWIAQKVTTEKKMLIIVALCRIPQGTNQGIQTSISQCNQMKGNITSATKWL